MSTTHSKIRVASINVLNTLDTEDLEKRYSLLSEALESQPADYLLLQELSDADILIKHVRRNGFTHLTQSADRIANNGSLSNCAIVSREPVEQVEHGVKDGTLAAGLIEHENGPVLLMSGHFPWGLYAEKARIDFASHIDSLAHEIKEEDPRTVSILGADCNALDDSRTLRFLTGKDVDLFGKSTLWVDAWVSSGADKLKEITNSPTSNSYAANTAKSVGIENPSDIPDRRIDFLLSQGWNYGRRGFPSGFMQLNHIDGYDYSDHKGILADFVV